MQLNSDISLALKIEDYLDLETGIVNCTAPTPEEFWGGTPSPNRCPFQEETIGTVNEYANNNDVWLIDFANVWEKMILKGIKNVKKLQKLIVQYNRSFESQSVTLAINEGSVSMENQQQNVGHLLQDDDNDKNDDAKDNIFFYYYIGSFFAAFCCVICMFYVVYRYYKRNTSLFLKQIEDCNDCGMTEQSNLNE